MDIGITRAWLLSQSAYFSFFLCVEMSSAIKGIRNLNIDKTALKKIKNLNTNKTKTDVDIAVTTPEET